MATPTFNSDVLVLKKIKLGESDLILRLLAADGSLLEAIAKGARKPTNTFSSRLELFNEAHVLCAKGRGLDIVKECRLLRCFPILHTDPLYNAAASCIAELALLLTQPDLPVERMFPMTAAAFKALADSHEEEVLPIVAAYLLKACALSGMRPSLTRCVSCGTPFDGPSDRDVNGRFSYVDGGVVCGECASLCETTRVSPSTLQAAIALLGSTFAEIAARDTTESEGVELIQFSHQWIMSQVGTRLRSIKDLISFVRI